MKLAQLQEARYASTPQQSEAYQWAKQNNIAIDDSPLYGGTAFALHGMSEKKFDKLGDKLWDLSDGVEIEAHDHDYEEGYINGVGLIVSDEYIHHPYILTILRKHGSTHWHEW